MQDRDHASDNLNRMQLTSHATYRTHQGTSRLAIAFERGALVKTQRALPSFVWKRGQLTRDYGV